MVPRRDHPGHCLRVRGVTRDQPGSQGLFVCEACLGEGVVDEQMCHACGGHGSLWGEGTSPVIIRAVNHAIADRRREVYVIDLHDNVSPLVRG